MSRSGQGRAEAPIRRINPAGEVVWVARYTGRDGRRRIAKPAWNRGRGTFARKRDAQRAINEAYEIPAEAATVGAYFETWTQRYPRSDRTNATNEHRISRVLDVAVEGIALRDWPLCELRRRHALSLADYMLRRQGRAVTGVVGILRSLSAMCEDAITDEAADLNAFKGVRLRANDPRAQKKPRPTRVFSFEDMHCFAAAAGRWEAMVRTFADTGLRLGEVLALKREDFGGETLAVRRTAHDGRSQEGTKTDHGELAAGRIVPCPPRLSELIRIKPPRIDTEWLFPTPTGRLWRERNFYRDVWKPAQLASGLDVRPHEMRHSYLSQLRAAGIDDADLAQIAGHRVETMLSRYVHPLTQSFSAVRGIIG